MAKRDDKHNIAEDYLAQVEWQSHHSRRQKDMLGFSNQPASKYKILSTKSSPAPLVARIIVVGGFLAAIGYLLYQAIFLRSGLAIFMGITFLFIGLILFLAARDASISKDRETDD
jgi:type IV secretory pathway VirB6-like protein